MSDDLRGAFGTPARAQLGGLLPKRPAAPAPAPTPPAPTEQVQPEPEMEPATDPAEPAAATETAPAPASSTAVEVARAGQGEDATTQVSVYLTPAAVAAVRRAKGRRTNADVALDAIDATVDRLPELLQARRTEARPGSLFPTRRRPRRGVRQGDHRTLWSMKATAAELGVIDRLVEQMGASSRSELIATAIEAHLTRPRRRR